MELQTNERVAGANIVTPDSDIPANLLEVELNERDRPTSEEHALQVAVFWGDEVLDEVQVRKNRPVTVGPRHLKGRSFDVEVDGDTPFEKYVIARNAGTSARVEIPPGSLVAARRADGRVERGLSPGPFELVLGDRLVFKHGTLCFRLEYVRGNAALGKAGLMDWYFPRVFAISALLHIFFVAAAWITPDVNRSMLDELLQKDNRFAQMILKAPEEEKVTKKLDLSGAKGAKAKGDEGKFGKKDKPQEDKLASKAGAPRVDPNKREKDRKIAMSSGLLGLLKGSGDSAVSNVFGPGGLGSGINNAMGGLRGTEMGDAGGAGGLGTRGTGSGGGGNSLGIGGLGTHGHGRGSGGYGNIDLGGRGKGRTRIVPGRTIIKGSLDKAEIARVIRQNLNRFKFCYEKELNANPNLAGKIAIYFTIAPTGTVPQASVRETSMNNKTVEDCTVKVMKSLKFPKPKGGGIVVVTYPFVFAST